MFNGELSMTKNSKTYKLDHNGIKNLVSHIFHIPYFQGKEN